MSKVEELREKLQGMLKGKEEEPHEHSDAWAFVAKLFVLLEEKWQGPLPDIVTMHIYAIQSSARSEGVAEGAAEEREKIRRMQLCGRRAQVSQFPDDERRNLRIETDVDGVAYTLVPVSVLAPTKEEK